MLPLTKAPRLPNIGFTLDARGSSGITSANSAFASSEAFGSCMAPPFDQKTKSCPSTRIAMTKRAMMPPTIASERPDSRAIA